MSDHLQTPHLLTITIYEAANLCKTDDDTIFSKMAKNTGSQNLDPFFYVEYAGCRQKSRVYKGVSCKVWSFTPFQHTVYTMSVWTLYTLYILTIDHHETAIKMN